MYVLQPDESKGRLCDRCTQMLMRPTYFKTEKCSCEEQVLSPSAGRLARSGAGPLHSGLPQAPTRASLKGAAAKQARLTRTCKGCGAVAEHAKRARKCLSCQAKANEDQLSRKRKRATSAEEPLRCRSRHARHCMRRAVGPRIQRRAPVYGHFCSMKRHGIWFLQGFTGDNSRL